MISQEKYKYFVYVISQILKEGNENISPNIRSNIEENSLYIKNQFGENTLNLVNKILKKGLSKKGNISLRSKNVKSFQLKLLLNESVSVKKLSVEDIVSLNTVLQFFSHYGALIVPNIPMDLPDDILFQHLNLERLKELLKPEFYTLLQMIPNRNSTRKPIDAKTAFDSFFHSDYSVFTCASEFQVPFEYVCETLNDDDLWKHATFYQSEKAKKSLKKDIKQFHQNLETIKEGILEKRKTLSQLSLKCHIPIQQVFFMIYITIFFNDPRSFYLMDELLRQSNQTIGFVDGNIGMEPSTDSRVRKR